MKNNGIELLVMVLFEILAGAALALLGIKLEPIVETIGIWLTIDFGFILLAVMVLLGNEITRLIED